MSFIPVGMNRMTPYFFALVVASLQATAHTEHVLLHSTGTIVTFAANGFLPVVVILVSIKQNLKKSALYFLCREPFFMSFHLAENTIFILHNEGDAFYLKNFIFWFLMGKKH